MNISIKTGY